MNQQQSWQLVTKLFNEALERAPEERSEFLKSACAGNTDLLREVESLLAQHDAETGFLEFPAVAAVADEIGEKGEPPRIGKKFGHYRIEAMLGRGGMGEVYLAQDKLGRKVALKLLTKRFPGDESGIARFQQEARTLLALNHPHIVTIHDIDQIEGVYYIASEFSSAYIEKGMFAEAVAEARKARELSPGVSHPFSFLGYALAKSGKQAEARAL